MKILFGCICATLGIFAAQANAGAGCDLHAIAADVAYQKAVELIPVDVKQAAAWFHVAALHGDREALRMLSFVPRQYIRVVPTCADGELPPTGQTAETDSPGTQSDRFRPAQPPQEIDAMVRRLAPAYGLDPAFVLAVIVAESSYNSLVVSPKQAAGLMQLIPETARRFGVRDVFDPEDNVRGGMAYLRWLLAYYQGDVTLALAGYNAGEGAVDRYGGVPPYAETREYIRRIRHMYPTATHPFSPDLTAPSPIIKIVEAQGK